MTIPKAGAAISRRRFIVSGAATVVSSHLITGCATARRGPSNQIAVGIIGCGGQGNNNTNDFLGHGDCRVVAACDVDKNHLEELVGKVNDHYKNKDCKGYHDYRELLAGSDIDAVMIAVPDHWHELVSVEAARRKKDVYGEKPLARTVAEQQAIVRAVEENACIWQTGSWQRSSGSFHKAAEIVRNGLIGKITRVEVGLPKGSGDVAKEFAHMMPSEPPPQLDYNTWTGPSEMMLYVRARVHQNWRWNYNTGGGQLLDWIGHHGDIAHWGLGFDLTGPSEVEGYGEFPASNAAWNTATKYHIECKYRKEVTKYPNDVALTISGGSPAIGMGTKWIGTDGWVWVDRAGIDASNPAWLKGDSLPDDLRKIKLYESSEHRRNFLDSVKSRKPTITPVETAHHSTLPGHLGLISMLVGRKIHWDVAQEKILNDTAASELLSRPYRAPWKFPA
jgi:predicted dehydrogenase